MAASNLDYRNTNSLWCSVIAATLARLGLRYAVIAPGSRSTPLTFAFVRHPGIETIPVLDERSAAFFALGLGRREHRPAALVCTSGTAAANFLPAVIEARESGVPLLVFTSDRPPEMRECASGQTVDQQKLYGGYPVFYQELAVPEASVALLRHARQAVAHAYERSLGPAAGPVHLNAPFRDPLPPVTDGAAGKLDGRIDDATFFGHLTPEAGPVSAGAATAGVAPSLRAEWERVERGLIVVGPAQPADVPAYTAAVARLAEALGWPVLADGLGPLREAPGNPLLVAHYNAVLRSPALAAKFKPEAVLCLGEWPTSKQLRQWLQVEDARVWLVNSDGRNRDALHARTRHLRCPVEALAADLAGARREPAAYALAWWRADAAAGQRLAEELDSLDFLFEGNVTRILAKHLPADTPVFAANSMPVRDVEFFWPAGEGRRQLYFNRGANGIDGTLSTALGVAHGNRPAVLLSGDLALLHDTNGFLVAPRLRGSLTVVLINNRGGGIFEMLPVAQFNPPFEEYFAMPQAVDFGRLCAAYGVEHVPVRDWAHFGELVSTLPESGVRVLEVRTDRKRDAALRRELMQRAAAAAEDAVAGPAA